MSKVKTELKERLKNWKFECEAILEKEKKSRRTTAETNLFRVTGYAIAEACSHRKTSLQTHQIPPL